MAFSMLACGKEETPLSMSFTQPIGETKEADTTFSTLAELVHFSTSNNSVGDFLANTQWKTTIDQMFTLAGTDTIYRRLNTTGKIWAFSFNAFTGVGMLARISSISSSNQTVTLASTYMLVNKTQQFDISNVTLYMDSTYSFSLKSVMALDTLQRVSLVKLQSFK